jgi:putative membrane protein
MTKEINKEKKMKLIIRWLITSASLFVAAYLVPGIRVEDQNAWKVFIVMALILGLVNALLRPILGVMSLPLIILTLGVFMLIINGVSFLIAARIAESMGIGFYVDSFWSAFLGSVIVSVVSMILSGIFKD